MAHYYRRQPKFTWDAATGHATCTLTYGTLSFTGHAFCAPEDQDMCSVKTGYNIALTRAELKYFTHLRDNELMPAYKALKHTYSCMALSKKFNPNSYESKLLRKQIKQLHSDLATVRIIINGRKKGLKNTIEEKEKFYQKVRANRLKQTESAKTN